MTKQVTLQFPTIEALLAFKEEVNAVVFEMNPRTKMLTCDCSGEHLEMAFQKYGAKEVDPQNHPDSPRSSLY